MNVSRFDLSPDQEDHDAPLLPLEGQEDLIPDFVYQNLEGILRELFSYREQSPDSEYFEAIVASAFDPLSADAALLTEELDQARFETPSAVALESLVDEVLRAFENDDSTTSPGASDV